MTGSLLILGWHNVAPTSGFPSVRGCGESGLRQQLRLLRRGADVVDLADALRDLQRGRELPRRAVAITFDDGYRDNVTLAAPLLRDLGLPATFFLVPEFLVRAHVTLVGSAGRGVRSLDPRSAGVAGRGRRPARAPRGGRPTNRSAPTSSSWTAQPGARRSPTWWIDWPRAPIRIPPNCSWTGRAPRH